MSLPSILAGLLSCYIAAVTDALTAAFSTGQRKLALARARFSAGPATSRPAAG